MTCSGVPRLRLRNVLELISIVGVVFLLAAPNAAAAPGAVARLAPGQPAPQDPNQFAIPTYTNQPPPGHNYSFDQAVGIAEQTPQIKQLVARDGRLGHFAYILGPDHWQVDFARTPSTPAVAAVRIDDATGNVLSVWTGAALAWPFARGTFFGGVVNKVWFWLLLCGLFIVPLADLRRVVSWRNADLAVLLSFSVSLAFFNHGHVQLSTVLFYPPLVYLLVRMVQLSRRRGQVTQEPLRLVVGVRWLAVACVLLAALHVGLDLATGQTTDVGLASVQGAHNLLHGSPLYSHWSGVGGGDTYGPVVYEAYAPFEALLGSSLLAQELAALLADLGAATLLFLLGRRTRDTTLGVVLAYGWLAFPFTLFTLLTNTNDLLVAVLVIACLVVADWAPARGAMAAVAGFTKFAPLALAPLLAMHNRKGSWRPVVVFAIAFLATAAVLLIPAFAHNSIGQFYDQTVGFQANRTSPLSIWTTFGIQETGFITRSAIWTDLQRAVEVAAILFAIGLAILPRREDVVGLAGACAAILIATQLGASYWVYMYLPWFLGPALLAIFGPLGRLQDPRSASRKAAERKQPPQRKGLSGNKKRRQRAVAR